MQKRFIFASLLILALLAVAGCGTNVGVGKVGVVVHKFGSQRGVQDFPATTGWVFLNPFTTEVISYPINVQTAVWTQSTQEGHPTDESITFTNKDSMVINADVSLSYSLTPEKVPDFYVKFRLEDIDKFTHGFLRNIARDKFNEVGGKFDISSIMGDNGPFLKQVRDEVQAEVAPYGVKVEQLGFIGAPRPPGPVIESINSKIQATQLAQQKENEVLQAKAEAQKEVATAEGDAKAKVTLAQAEAEANRVRTSSLTPAMLELKRLENQRAWIEKWDGQTPNTVLGSGGDNKMLFNIPASNK